MTYKELLSAHVENIFKGYASPGLHICDIATGGGKSYTIGKLTCEFYPKMFERIIILCVQNKLVGGMDREIEKFIDSDKSLINPSDKLVIENNPEVMSKAFESGSFKALIEDMEHIIGEQKRKGRAVNRIESAFQAIKKDYESLSNLVNTLKSINKNDLLQSHVDESEAKLRKKVRTFFDLYKKHLEINGDYKKVSQEMILRQIPSLAKVYPQVEYKKKRVLIMTVHKAMYGIDPILSEKIQLRELTDKKTLILFDESDQAAIAMRSVIIDQSINSAEGNGRFAKGYKGYLLYKDLIENPQLVSTEYYGELLEKSISKANDTISKNWERTIGNIEPYKSIFLAEPEDTEKYRRGVFFSGQAFKLNISPRGSKTFSYICYKEKDRHFCLAHAENAENLKKEFSFVIPLEQFLSLAVSNTTVIKSQLRNVILEALQQSREKFENEERAIAANTGKKYHYLGYPSLEREIHTLLSRFEKISETQFIQQMHEFITNRKNISILDSGKELKLPDYSVYTQGLQLYQEEIDEMDNQHRVLLSCREITTTPEKIIVDLLQTGQTSVVLCSATASSKSVVSNFDISYLKQTLGEQIHSLSEADRLRFDELVGKTYPKDHRIVVHPLKKHVYKDMRENHITLPEKYKNMFSDRAIENGLADRWFKITIRQLKQEYEKTDEWVFQLNRLYQFIEAYNWFITHDDIHSMLYFQNRTGDKDRGQINLLSCLIDGSFEEMDTPFDEEIPRVWQNKHICISKDWEDVENNILSRLGSDKDAKLMLVSAYGSFKAGANLQYEIPEGLDYIDGDNWTSEGEKLKKDWDAVYLQSPTAYLMMNSYDFDAEYEKSLYNVMLTLMMLHERGCLSREDINYWICNALSNHFYFGENNNPGIVMDKAAWAQTTLEQAVGRLCRTKNKPRSTYILFDESIIPFFKWVNTQKSLTKEFRALVDHIEKLSKDGMPETSEPEEIILCNIANDTQARLNRIRSIALRYTVHHSSIDEEFDDELEEDREIPHNVLVSQIMNQCYKQTIIKKPVIYSLDELDDTDKHLTFIHKCYGKWKQDKDGCYTYFMDKTNHDKICPATEKGYAQTISPSTVRLDILMKNPVIRNHFEKNGFATTWKEGGLILHPLILASDYAGEIGEEAFLAIVLHYTNCTADDIKHLKGKDYELADFVVCNPDGSYKIAFDVKNMNPDFEHIDRRGDMTTSEKRKMICKRLGCELITVNMLQIGGGGMDDNREIRGVIDNEGIIIPSAIEQLQKLLNV